MNEKQPKYMQSRDPDLTVKFYLVPHGYQVSFYDSQGELVRESLRDFARSRPVEFWVDKLIVMTMCALTEMRRVYDCMGR